LGSAIRMIQYFINRGGRNLPPRRRQRSSLRGIVGRPERHDVRLHGAMEMGRPAETTLEFGEKHRVDRIVMSTHGRTGLGRWVFGSVAEKVLRAANRTVVLVRPPSSAPGT
jgi:nucleotide-binding universal stress UspA family protein